MIRFPWIESRGADLLWYVGSPLLGLIGVPAALVIDAARHARGGPPGPAVALAVDSWGTP